MAVLSHLYQTAAKLTTNEYETADVFICDLQKGDRGEGGHHVTFFFSNAKANCCGVWIQSPIPEWLVFRG
uniref:Uncharacterized protein n=1 Tax=Anguilla anguilla TaxID=7936 RepID=A0A0E9XWJ6_ANGAN